ncbi:MAG: hypothetical protein E7317_01515 [Clostridiales bacterium]|nr:hypothetical protein [Clostridiales bacterium]
MKNGKGHFLALWAIALALFVVLALAIPFARTPVYWIGFCATLLMFAVVTAAFMRAFRDGRSLESALLGWPIFKCGALALGAQLIAGFALMALARALGVTAAVVIEIVLFGCAAAVLVARDAARAAVEQTEARVRDDTGAWKALRAQASAFAAAAGSDAARKLADDIRFADPRPTDMDGDIAQAVGALGADAADEDIEQVRKMVGRRNALAKAGKKEMQN